MLFLIFCFIFHGILPSSVFSQISFSYYRRFTGYSFPDYDYLYPSSDLCETTLDCSTSLKLYEYWSTNSTAYNMSSSIIDRSTLQQTFGKNYFGQWDAITKSFYNISTHTTVTVEVSVASTGWNNEAMIFTVDGYVQTLNFLGSTDQTFTASISHNSSNLTIQLQSNLNDPPSVKTYGIHDFSVTLGNGCPASCIYCSSGTCTKCPFFSSLNSTYFCQCMNGFIMTSQSNCARCDLSCATCSGTTSSQCLSCLTNINDTLNTTTGTCTSPSSTHFILILIK